MLIRQLTSSYLLSEFKKRVKYGQDLCRVKISVNLLHFSLELFISLHFENQNFEKLNVIFFPENH